MRTLSITPAAAIGGLLWKLAPEVPFVIAGIIGLIGTVVFALTVEERYASQARTVTDAPWFVIVE